MCSLEWLHFGCNHDDYPFCSVQQTGLAVLPVVVSIMDFSARMGKLANLVRTGTRKSSYGGHKWGHISTTRCAFSIYKQKINAHSTNFASAQPTDLGLAYNQATLANVWSIVRAQNDS